MKGCVELLLAAANGDDVFIERRSNEVSVTETFGTRFCFWKLSEECIWAFVSSQVFFNDLVLYVGVFVVPLYRRVLEVQHCKSIAIKATHVVRKFGLEVFQIWTIYDVAFDLNP